ncbi:unnamed protein product [Rotaria magnacalcarata]|uniref:G-protein coupled receptors family 1 profile domain-containing protein n=1 Tax=Rotaria magnacalcarata TaxID=392030 RepID=A0A817AUG7_9BILA|nr:unnamed protein product [Rotaria magnacalcarata]
MDDTSLQYDCLFYRVRHEKLAFQELSNIIDNTIPYCFRPDNETEMFSSDLTNLSDRIFTFDELRRHNITTQQLLSWSAPIDLVEQYQFYLDESNSSLSLLSNELFYNCTKPWFGLRCQYSFEFSEELSIYNIVEAEFSRKASYSESSKMLITLPCYVHLKCDRGGPLCLDWREVCDGRVDCLDGGLDEAFCFDVEINECSETEYRCHNGLCIPEEFWNDGIGDADCLDRSDEIADVAYPRSCFQDPTFRCEEHACRMNWHQFPCGDGQCVQKFDKCHNGRHALLIQSMALQGDMSNNCWIIMICLTMLNNEVNGISCESWLMNDSVIKFLQTCEIIFQFPIIPVHFGHIRLLYERPYLKFNQSSFLMPDYICYDQLHCDCIIPTFFHRNLTCLHSYRLQLHASISGHPWIDMILEINSYFSSCLILHTFSDKKAIYHNYSLLHHCQNSAKYISKHRIADENKDCCMGDDEDNRLSCLINDKYRVKCPNQSICLSSLHSIHDCPESQNQYHNNVPFHIFCDGFEEHFFEDFNGQSYTDESECNYWPCNNIYSRCDGFWACPNGDDEENCHPKVCPSEMHPCISPTNYSLTCLSAEQVGDVQQSPKSDILTSINPRRECFSIEHIFNSTIMKMPRFHRIKFYHIPCQTNFDLNCFIDETYLCLCTNDHHANCVKFDRHKNLECPSTNYCTNGAQCRQDHPNCPSTVICVCNECFFGSQCQFYSKGFGLTLDEILGYEIKRNIFLFDQPFSVKLSALITMIMFTIGTINGIFSIITFKNKTSQAVGCGMYLLASSITSLMIVILFTLKFWFLIFSYIDSFAQRLILYSNCMLIEPLLKILLYIDNWLNGCVAAERAFAVFKGVYFDKKTSRKLAKWVIIFMIIINVILLIPQLSYLHLFDDEKEERTWCVILYSSSLHIYNSFIIFFHFFTPFFINLFSAIFIIIATARQRGITQTENLYMKQFKNKLKQHKHLFISPVILILLSLPRLIISFTLDCKKSSKHFWLYLIGYFVSFMPSILIFVVFVLPSTIFKRSFKEAILHGRRRIPLLKMNFYSK